MSKTLLLLGCTVHAVVFLSFTLPTVMYNYVPAMCLIINDHPAETALTWRIYIIYNTSSSGVAWAVIVGGGGGP